MTISSRVGIVASAAAPGATAAVRKAVEELALEPVLLPSDDIRRLAPQDDLGIVLHPAGDRSLHARVRLVADLEMAGFRYAGSGLAPGVLALSPAAAYRSLEAGGTPLPGFAVCRSADVEALAQLDFPVLVRCTEITGATETLGPLLAEDPSSLGLALRTAKAGPSHPALVLRRPTGPRFSVAVIGNEGPQDEGLLTFVERLPGVDGADLEGRRPEAARAALTAYRALGCRDYAEVRLVAPADGAVLVESIDPAPCLDPRRSAFVRAVTSSGLSLTEAIGSILETAGRRLGRRVDYRARA